jgi:hypothetical protein
MSAALNTRAGRVAIVAVHGISDQLPCSTARALTDLLLLSGHYDAARETGLRIPVERVLVSGRHAFHAAAAQSSKQSFFARFDERSPYLAACQATRPMHAEVRAASVESSDIAHNFMRELISYYPEEAAKGVYETVRLETVRRDSSGCPDAEVHIYEMYWADLSRLSSGLFKILAEFYQLLFHICHLGRQTADFATAEHTQKDSPVRSAWQWFSFFHRWAVRILTLPVPILSLILAALLLLVLVAALPSVIIAILAIAIPLVALIAFVGATLQRRPRNYLVWLLSPGIATIVYASAWSMLNHEPDRPWQAAPSYRLLAIELILAAAIPVGWIISKYDQRRPGANYAALTVAPFVLLTLMVSVLRSSNSAHGYVSGLAAAMEVIYIALEGAWLLFLVATWLACIAGIAVYLRAARGSRSVRALFTAILTLALPAALFILVTLPLYAALSRLVAATIESTGYYQPTWLGSTILGLDGPIQFGESLNRLLLRSGTAVFQLFAACLVLVVLLLVWSFFPAVWAELRVPPRDQARSRALGQWLNSGYRGLIWVAVLLLMAVPVILTIGVVAQFTLGRLSESLKGLPGDSLLLWLGALVLGGTTTLLAFHGRLSNLAIGFRPALDAILDIDNYLREYPRAATPRARIFSRYASLLRYLCNYSDPSDGRGYDKIVIVAHSQGTVISADLLQFVRREADPALNRLRLGAEQSIPISLLTVGCPLRQLYGWRFPHLYSWAYHDNGAPPLGFKSPDIIDSRAPDPYLLLGVREWINAYRSGDYVGRHLWRNDRCGYLWDHTNRAIVPNDRLSVDSRGSRREFCIGPGAHTHYFDDAAELYEEIDRII